MKITSKSVLVCLLASFTFFACKKKNNDNSESLTSQDRTFMQQASFSNAAEIQAANLVDSISTSSTGGSTTDSTGGTTDSTGGSGGSGGSGAGSAIGMFAQKMITDHTNAQNDLKTLANNVNITMSTDSIDANHLNQIDSLRMFSGRALDSVYILSQIRDHQNAISNFQQEVSTGNRTEVINYANKYLPVLQMHLQMADSLASAMNFK
jgi:putative membrane protein